MSAPTPIRFLYPVRIKHRQTNRYLVSDDFRYRHRNSSNQQLVGATPGSGENTVWTFKHANASSHIPVLGYQFGNGDTVRLEHAGTNKNLHSHKKPSPVSGQQEVTAFGGQGVGDDNDEWELEVLSVAGDGASAEITLKHKATGMFLHSHNHTLPQPPLPDLHEVTAFDDKQDPNNIWVVEPAGEQPLELSRVRTVVPIPDRQLLFDVESTTSLSHWAELAETWVQKEAEAWAWLTGAANSANPTEIVSIQPIVAQFQSGFRRIRKAIERVRQEHDARNFADSLVGFQNEFAHVYSGSDGLLFSREPRAIYVSGLSAENPFTAAVACGIFAGMNPPISSANGIRGVCAAIDFENRNGSESENAHSAAFEHFRRSLQSQSDQVLGKLRSDHDSVAEQLTALNSEASLFAKRAENLVSSASESFAALESALRKKVSLDGSITYWGTRASNARKKAGWFGFLAVIAMIVSVVSILLATSRLFGWDLSPAANYAAERKGQLGTSNQPPIVSFAASIAPPAETQRFQEPAVQYWRYFLLAVLLTFEVWLCRILARIAISSLHTSEDAQERVTMLQTFLSLSSDQSVDRKDDVKLILQTVFRPGSTGLIQEDAGIQTPLEMVLKNISGDARSGSGRSNS